MGRLHLTEFANRTSTLSIAAVKHGLVVLDREFGKLYLLDTSDLIRLVQAPLALLIYTIPPHHTRTNSYIFDIKEARLATGNLLLLNIISPISNDESLLILEYQPSQVALASVSQQSPSNSWLDFTNFKMPV
jgi:hypothetical protein